MTPVAVSRPAADEHAPYFGRYIALVPEGDLFDILTKQGEETAAIVTRNGDKSDHAYEPGKWTVKEVVGHIVDCERIFGYRALRFARGDGTELPGFDENAYVDNANFADRTLEDLLAELRAVRASTIALGKGLDSDALARRGKANGKEISVRALLYLAVGHQAHHVALLRDRYGLAG